MSDIKEKNEGTVTNFDENRRWLAPEFTVLDVGATASGVLKLCTSEGFNYHTS